MVSMVHAPVSSTYTRPGASVRHSGGRRVPNAAEPPEQAERPQQPALAFRPGGRWHGGQIRRRGQAEAGAGEAHQPAEDTRQ